MTAGMPRSSATSLAVRVRKTLAKEFSLEAEFAADVGFTILFGPSGSGKTTVLNCIAGLIKPDAGRVAVGGQLIFDSEQGVNVPPRKRYVGYLFRIWHCFHI